MEPFSIGAAIIAGLVATAVMTGIMYLIRNMMPDDMPLDTFYLMGTIVTSETRTAYIMGGVMHFAVGIVFGIIQVLVYQAFEISSGLYLWGILLGGINWLIVGAGMGMIGAINPIIRDDQMVAPGLFVRNLPMLTVVSFFVLHIVFGIVNGGVYEGLRGLL